LFRSDHPVQEASMAHQHATSDYMAHGYCFSWEPGLVWLHVTSDIITGMAYFSIPLAMFYFAYKRRDLPFYKMFILFATFILSCGTTHFFAAYTVFDPIYWQEGYVKAVTAVVSAISAVLFIPLLPKAIAFPSLTQALTENEALNAQLSRKIGEFQEAARTLEQSNHELHLSENRFRTIFDITNDAIFIHELPSGAIVDVNQTMCEMYGYTREEVFRLDVNDLSSGVPPYTGAEAGEWVQRAAKGKPLLFEWRARHKSGRLFWVEVHMKRAVIGDEDRVIVTVRDITQRKQAEETRNKALAFNETLLAASPTGIHVYNGVTGDCVMANQAVADIVGGTIDEIIAQNFREIASWRESGLYQLSESVLNDGVTRQTEKALTTTFGKFVVLDCFLSRFDVDGVPMLMFIAVDITEKRRLEENNKHIEAQMLHVQKLESLGVLAGGIAHDFNNILMAVLGNADLALMRMAPESPARDNLLQIEQAAQRAADLARQMLAYSGKGRFVVESLNMTALVEEMTHMLEVSISKKALLRFNFSPDLPAVDADATQLRQVIMNLVINASEAIGDTSGVIAISTGAMECDSAYLADTWINDRLPEGLYVYLEVADTGCGIEREAIPKIFDPFFTTKFTGRGLGMAAVLGIVRGHKGAIKVYSEPGKGTTFRLLLPVSPGTAHQHAGPTDDDAWRGSGTVLLVDDEETIRALGKDMLKELGFTAVTASDGREALDVFDRNRDGIVCVILDLTMPRLDGEQTFRELRRIKPDVRVIMSSGYNEQEVTQKFAGKGLAGFIQKPYKLMEVSRKLREVLEGAE
jgi:PAS domain S-box-containing protein